MTNVRNTDTQVERNRKAIKKQADDVNSRIRDLDHRLRQNEASIAVLEEHVRTQNNVQGHEEQQSPTNKNQEPKVEPQGWFSMLTVTALIGFSIIFAQLLNKEDKSGERGKGEK